MTRRQALAWAKDHAAEVVPVLVRALAERPIARLPYDGIRPLGEIRHPKVGEALVALLQRPGFPWKPQAIEALADLEFPGAAGAFAGAASSPVARSRAAACRGIGALGIKEMDGLVSRRLDDEEAAVRLEAAKALIRMGDWSGLPRVIRDLSLDRRFADFDPGEVARDAAAAFLKEHGADVKPSPAPVASAGELAALLAFFKTKLGPLADKFPETVAPHEPDRSAGFRHAIEVRSCLEGDVFIRVDGAGRVLLGRDLLREFQVDPELTRPIMAALDSMDTGPKGRRILGPVTCDFERLAISDGTGWKRLEIGAGKGETWLPALDSAVAEVLRATRGAPAADAHARRVRPFHGAAPASRPESAPAQSGR
jgi:hypothetical protein